MRIVHVLAVALACFVIPAIAHAHPADGYPPVNPPPVDAHVVTSPLTGTYGDLTFGSCQMTVGELSPAELYILHGARGSSYGTGGVLPEWYHDIFMIANAIRSQTGSLPLELSVAAISETTGSSPNVARLEHFKSPITGQFPRLDAIDFAPGQVYMRELTDSEMHQFASLAPEYQQIWFDGEVVDPETCQVIKRVKLISPVYYIRVYGQHGVLVETLQYLMTSR